MFQTCQTTEGKMFKEKKKKKNIEFEGWADVNGM